MSDDLLESVRTFLLPTLEPLGFEIAESRTFNSFDNAWVAVQSDEMRIRIVRERSQILVGFGPPNELGTWFDSDIVFEHLGLSVDRSFDHENVKESLHGVATFLIASRADLARMFDAEHLACTKQAIKTLKERRAERLFGWTPPTRRAPRPDAD